MKHALATVTLMAVLAAFLAPVAHADEKPQSRQAQKQKTTDKAEVIATAGNRNGVHLRIIRLNRNNKDEAPANKANNNANDRADNAGADNAQDNDDDDKRGIRVRVHRHGCTCFSCRKRHSDRVVEDLKDEIDRLERHASDTRDQIDHAGDNILALEDDLHRALKDLAEAEMDAAPGREQIAAAQAELHAATMQVNDADHRIDTIVNRIQAEYRTSDELEELRSQLRQAEADHREVIKRVTASINDAPRIMNMKQMIMNTETALEQEQQASDRNVQRITQLATKLMQLKQSLADQREAFVDNHHDAVAARNRIADLQRKIAKVEKALRAAFLAALEVDENYIAALALRDEARAYELAKRKIHNQIAAENAPFEKLVNLEQQNIARLRSRIAEYQARRSDLRDELVDLEERVGQKENRIVNVRRGRY